MTGKDNRAVAKLRQKRQGTAAADAKFHAVHCIIHQHQEVLCSKVVKVE